MKQSKMMRAWNIIYPIGVYFVVTTLTLFILDFVLPESVDTKLFRQLLTSVTAFFFLHSYYASDQIMRGKGNIYKEKVVWRFSFTVNKVKKCIIIFFIGGFFAVAWNQILALTGVAEYSTAYQEIEQTFYMGRIALEILALCIVIPIVEELLYRGIVYGRLKDWLGMKTAVVVSAVIFGLIHMNLVQFVYASVFGLLLAWFTEETGDISGAVAAHMAANLTSVIRAESGVLSFLEESIALQMIVIVILLLICGIGMLRLRKMG